MATAAPSHIWLDDRGVAWIDNSNIKVIEVALEQIAHGFSAEEIFDQHAGYLTLAQIHAALAHYYDRQDEFDELIRQQLEEFDRSRAATRRSWSVRPI